MKEISDQLIQQFLSNQCTEEEAVQIEAHFNAHPEALEKYISINDLLTDETGVKLETEISQKMLRHIERNTTQKTTKTARLTWMKYAAAASIAGILLVTSIKYFGSNDIATERNSTTAQLPILKDTVISNLKTVINNTSATMVVSLQDGSSVDLSAGSTLQYNQPFTNKKRQLFLTGTAFFKVAKDKTMPFIVSTNGISTTALGTSFKIVAEKNSNNIVVQLFTGKVKVSKDASDNYAFNTIYLLPGKQLQINTTDFQSTVTVFKLKNSDVIVENSKKTSPEDLLNFNQTALPEVFAAIEKTYKVTITYTNKDLINMKFTGRFNSQEEVTSILNNIALLNGLTVAKTTTGFEIKK
jgi:ferric-dicitrate binding protein FerR (iron transport regulator)